MPAALEPDTEGCLPRRAVGGRCSVSSSTSSGLSSHSQPPSLLTGVLLGVQGVPSPGYAEDPELSGLFHPMPGMPCQPPSLPEEDLPGAVYLLCKQGKSWHCQLWDYDQVRDSNMQLTDFSPSRAADGREYVVPAGGVRAGLCGQALLLRPRDPSH
ncbi:UPF0692 protein C19orf54 homolog [Pteropus vampyrus]|uniref:Actin maturation protease n=1 Tax=Pteropus vampyrus TaxID=132908 RepID=A0A6P6C5A0_PTEVA|nr:UPF0692 protein C19orf54 homolog [Pteropus vampyrus]